MTDGTWKTSLLHLKYGFELTELRGAPLPTAGHGAISGIGFSLGKTHYCIAITVFCGADGILTFYLTTRASNPTSLTRKRQDESRYVPLGQSAARAGRAPGNP